MTVMVRKSLKIVIFGHWRERIIVVQPIDMSISFAFNRALMQSISPLGPIFIELTQQ